MRGIKNYSYLSIVELNELRKQLMSKILIDSKFTSKDKIMSQFRDSNRKRLIEVDSEIKRREAIKKEDL